MIRNPSFVVLYLFIFVYGKMDQGRVVFDISSDEEESGVTEPKGDYGWINAFLGITGEEQPDHDSDDEVVVLGEVKARSKSSKPMVRDLDDDCVVLDGDPDKPVVDDSVSDSDEVLVVGEKGPVRILEVKIFL